MDGQALWEERQKQPLGATYKNDVKYLSGGWNSGSVTKREAKTSEFTLGRERERERENVRADCASQITQTANKKTQRPNNFFS
jgi:hypothetical protein